MHSDEGDFHQKTTHQIETWSLYYADTEAQCISLVLMCLHYSNIDQFNFVQFDHFINPLLGALYLTDNGATIYF